MGINVNANTIFCNDKMTQIISLYKAIQSQSVEDTYNHIYKRIEQFNLSMTNKEGYLQLRELYNKEKKSIRLVCMHMLCI